MAASCGSSTRCNMLGFGGPNSIFRREPLAADGADVRAIAAAQHLNAIVAVIGYNKVAFAVKRGSTRAVKLSFAAAFAADVANERAVEEVAESAASSATVKTLRRVAEKLRQRQYSSSGCAVHMRKEQCPNIPLTDKKYAHRAGE